MFCMLISCLAVGSALGRTQGLPKGDTIGSRQAWAQSSRGGAAELLGGSAPPPAPRLSATGPEPEPRHIAVESDMKLPVGGPEDRESYSLQVGSYWISSLNFPNNYPNSVHEGFTARGALDQTIFVSCSSFDVEGSQGCTKDYFSVNDERFCGTDGPSVGSRELKIAFNTDNAVSRPGFKCWLFVPPLPPSSCCGHTNRASRIVGGQETEVREYPWQAAIVSSGSSFPWCGGSVINDRYVLTAAHCVDGKSAGSIQLLLGEHRVSSSDGEQRVNVGKIIIHPSYAKLRYDFALLKLTRTISFANNQIGPACLAEGGGQFSSVDAVVTGWGRTAQGGSSSSRLREVTVRTVTNSQCRASYGNIYKEMLCAGVKGGGKDSCQGDSGGPLVTQMDDNRYMLIGVVSWGRGCARPSYPGVYARVTSAYSWIMDNTADANLC